MKTIFIFIIFISSFVVSFMGYAQEIDSLNQALREANTNTKKIQTYLALLEVYSQRVDSLKIEHYLKELIFLAEKDSNLQAKADAYTLYGQFLSNKGNYTKAKKIYQDALYISKSIPYKKGIAEAYFGLGEIAIHAPEFEKALEYYQEYKKYTPKLYKYYQAIANLYYTSGEYSKSLEASHQSLKIKKDLNIQEDLHLDYKNLGNIYHRQHEIPKAGEYYLKALKESLKSQDSLFIGKCYGNLALIYDAQENHEKSLEYASKAIKVFEQVGNKVFIAIAYTNIGLTYANLNQSRKAMESFQISVKLSKQIQNKALLAFAYSSIATLLVEKQNKFQESIKYATESLRLRIEIGYKHIAEEYGLLGKSYFHLQQFEEASKNLQKCLQIAENLKLPEYTQMASDYLSRIYALQKDYKSAYQMHQLFKQSSDSITEAKHNKKLVQKTMQYEFDQEKAQKEAEYQNQMAQEEQKLQQQKYLTIGAVGAFTFVVILAFIIYRNQLKQKQLNQALEQQKEEISAQAKALQNTNDKLAELDYFKEQMTSMIAHDIKNPLNTIIALTNEYSFRKDNLKYIKQAGYEVLNLVTNMLDVYKYENTQLEIQTEKVYLEELLQMALQQLQVAIEQKSLTIKMDLSQDFVLQVDKELIVRVSVNILSNAIKYSPMNAKIYISPKVENSFLKLRIRDEGNGIPKNLQGTIFQKFSQVNAQKYGAVYSTGLGLTFAKMVIEAHKGQIGVISEIKAGTEVWFTVPLEKVQMKVTKKQNPKTNYQLIELNDLDEISKEILDNYLSQLREFEIYEASEIIDILHQIPTDLEPINLWKNQVQEAVLTYNEADFKKLTQYEGILKG